MAVSNIGCGRWQTIQTSNNPDFTSILRVEDKIFSITHYESPTPGVAYLTELSQDKDSGKLTVAAFFVPCLGCAAHIGFVVFVRF